MSLSKMLLVTLHLLLAGTPPETGDAQKAGSPASNPQAPEAARVVEARKRLEKVLPVDGKRLDAAARHVATAESVKAAPTDEALCALVSSANALQEQLYAPLNARRDTLYALPPPAPGAPDLLDEFSKNVDRADELLPGVGLGVGAETFYCSVRYSELAELAARGSGTQRVLSELGKLLGEPGFWPVYMEQRTDTGGCAKPGALLQSLRSLSKVWGQAPQCLQQQLTPVVVRAMNEGVSSTCYCDGMEQTSKQLRQLEAEYKKFPVAGAKEAAAKVRKALKDPELRFNCE